MIQQVDYHRTRAALVAIPELVTMLQTELIEGHQPSSSRTKPGSRPPAPIGLLSDLDEAWNILTTWTRDWCETFDFSAPAPYWPDVAEFLGKHWPNMAEQHPAATEFADEVAGVRSSGRASVWILLSRHTVEGQPMWRKLPGRWHCPIDLAGDSRGVDGHNTYHPHRNYTPGISNACTAPEPCGGVLLQKAGEWFIRCADDHEHSWTGEHEIERLGRLLGCEVMVNVEQAAALAHVNQATIYRWIERKWLPVLSEKGRAMVDKRDLVRFITKSEAG